MERRVLLAVFLSFLVLYVYQALIGPPPPAPGTDPTVAAPPAVETGRAAASRDDDPPRPRPQITAVEPPSPDPVIGDTSPRDVVVESDWFRATFTNRGAELVSFELKEYLDQGQPVELVPRELPSEEPWPFSLEFADESLSRLAHEALFRPSTDRLRLTDEPTALEFAYQDANGLRIQKTFRFDPATSPYLFDVSIEAAMGDTRLNPALRWGPALGGVESSTSGFAFRQGPRGVVHGRVLEGGVMQEFDTLRLDSGDVAVRPEIEGQASFLGVDNHYFLAAALPRGQEAMVRYRHVPLPPRVPDGDPRGPDGV